MIDPNILSSNLKLLRKKKGISQEILAQKIGITRSSIAAYETKNIEPRLRTLLDLAREFDIDIATFIKVKLKESSNFPPYKKESVLKDIPGKINLSNEMVVEHFLRDTVSMKKILDSFKIYLEFKKEVTNGTLTNVTEKIIRDAEDFTELMDIIIRSNELFIQSFNDFIENIEEIDSPYS